MAIKLEPIVMDKRTAKRRAATYASVVNTTSALTTTNNTINTRALASIDQGLHETYLALGKGQKVIDIRQVFKDAGQDDNLRPNLGIARADWRAIGLRRLKDGSLRFSDPVAVANTYGAPEPKIYSLPVNTLPIMPNHEFVAAAMVPTIPPKLRPDKLDQFVLIWEVFDWKGIPEPVPSRFSMMKQRFAEKAAATIASMSELDPILLRPLGGPLYAVIAAWDLTPIEATIIGAM